MTKEFKSFTLSPETTKVIDGEQGIVEHIVAVMGNVDEGGDIIHPGAFSKTIMERGGKIRVLDQHRTDSISCVIGKPLELRELTRQTMPTELLLKYPDAQGALLAKTQFLLDTPEGAGAFKRIKAGAVDEYSIGYDAIDKDFSQVTRDGKDMTVRNLRTVRLWEYSPVLWGMNQGTTTLSAKSADEAKPYGVIREGERWAVYKIGVNGEPVGEPLGTHDTEEEATAQVQALYAAEPGHEKDDLAISETETPDDSHKEDLIARAKAIIEELSALVDAAEQKEQQAGPEPPPTGGDDDIDRQKMLDTITIELAALELGMEVQHNENRF